MALERLEYFIGSTGDLTILNLKQMNVKPPVPVTDATVTARMLDAAGDPVSGVTDNLVMAAVSGVAGMYRGTVEAAASVAVGDTGEFVITAVSGTAGTRVFYQLYEVVKG